MKDKVFTDFAKMAQEADNEDLVGNYLQIRRFQMILVQELRNRGVDPATVAGLRETDVYSLDDGTTLQ